VSGSVPIDGERLRRTRLSRVISRPQLAERTGLGYSTLAGFETGFKTHARPEIVQRLAAALRVKPESLVDLKKL
jgi:transcriptional regulator with XRE-family HTH domain